MNEGYGGEDRDDQPEYRDRSEIQQHELSDGLRSLLLLRGDPFMSMQATNLALIDDFIMDIECDVMLKFWKEDQTPSDVYFLSAQSQMWIFAAYELLRTWRERAREIEALVGRGKLKQRIEELEADRGYQHFGHEAQVEQMKAILDSPSLLNKLREDLRAIYFPFWSLEYVRVMLAKHQMPKNPKVAAYAPGYGRINRWCGALDYHLDADRLIIGTVNRRQIADGIRLLADRTTVPTDDEIAEHREFVKSLRTIKVPEFD